MDEEFDLNVELDLPQPNYGDEETLKEYGLWMSAFEEQHGRPPSEAEMCAWIEAHRPPVIERYEKVTVDFTNCRQLDGTYIHNELPADAACHICLRLITAHSREQLHECALKQQQLKQTKT